MYQATLISLNWGIRYAPIFVKTDYLHIAKGVATRQVKQFKNLTPDKHGWYHINNNFARHNRFFTNDEGEGFELNLRRIPKCEIGD